MGTNSVDRRVLNRELIKYIAIIAMVLNHFASIFMDYGSILRVLFLGVGNFTAITMCYFLVEGYTYTHSKQNYAKRLFAFAV